MSLYELQREAVIIGDSFTQILTVTPDDIRRLWAATVEEHGTAWVRSLHKAADRSDSIDVHVSDDRISLWLGETPLAQAPPMIVCRNCSDRLAPGDAIRVVRVSDGTEFYLHRAGTRSLCFQSIGPAVGSRPLEPRNHYPGNGDLKSCMTRSLRREPDGKSRPQACIAATEPLQAAGR